MVQLKPKLDTPDVQQAINDYIAEFRKIAIQLDNTSDETLTLLFRQHLPKSLVPFVDTEINRQHIVNNNNNVGDVKPVVKLETVMQLAAMLAPTVQDSWRSLRNFRAAKNPQLRHEQQQQQQQQRGPNTQINAVQYSGQKRNFVDNERWETIKKYCKEHNLCFKCKQPYHGANRFKPCQNEQKHLSDAELGLKSQSQ